jgi:outer membrane receptor protein involved in Fe transport
MEFLRRAVSIVEPIEGMPPLPSSVDPDVSATSVDWLPGVTAILTPKERMNIRLSYGYTVVHPQFREFAPVNYFDFARRRQISGNPDLERTHIHNADVRWEWLPTVENSLIATSFFYKRFLNPIERVNASAGSRDLVFDNADGGYNVGGEVEVRASFGMFDDASNWLDWFSLNANVALVFSRVTLSSDNRAAQPDPVRPMFFQSPYVANLSLSFDHPDSGVVLTLAYNSVGKRIVEVGAVTSGTVSPNIVEQPFHSLDLIGSYEMNDHWKLNLAVRNLLGADRWQTAGGTVVERFNPGTEFGIGVGYTN